MIKRAVAVMAAAACLTSFAIGVSAKTDEPMTFRVENASGATLTALYVSTPSALDFDADVLGRKVVRSGEIASISVDSSVCDRDLRAEFSDGETADMREVDLCKLKGAPLTVGG
ncbi:hypothetical protein [Caulobacter sp. 17J80-11]|uniref:hypothetical protein n=1 Tax=Caulobacter sp. 17J80-11 TaxID=2763502 RepID=UPI001653EB49|nr:hypothetical protein [Caulobacter sp. 17J80-11]MBC6983064.1 hypothetical protein [Caulobacter sp. 17J80-11]